MNVKKMSFKNFIFCYNYSRGYSEGDNSERKL